MSQSSPHEPAASPPDDPRLTSLPRGDAEVQPRERTLPPRTPSKPERRVPVPAARPQGELEVTWEAPEAEPRPSFLERHERAALWSLLIVGIALRLVPILWGSAYLDSTQVNMHPDEPKLVRHLDDFPASLADYHDYRYPTLLPFAYGALWAPVGEALDLREPGPSVAGKGSYEAALIFGRALNVLIFGLGGLLLIWAFTRRLYGVGPALLAVAAANVMGRPVTSAALVLPDVSSAVLLFATFFLLARAESKARLSNKAMLGVGVVLGLATAAKYTSGIGVLGVLAVIGFAWSRKRIDGRRAAELTAIAGSAALGTFLLCVPGILYDTQNFLHSLDYEFGSKMLQDAVALELYPRAFLRSFPLWLMAVAALGVALAPRLRRELNSHKSVALPSACVALALYFAVSARSFRADYVLPFFPFVAMFAGVGLWKILMLPMRGVGAVVVSVALLFGTAQSARWVTQRYTADTNYRAGAWIRENLPSGKLGLAPSPLARSVGVGLPPSYQYVGVREFPRYILISERGATIALDALRDPAAVQQEMIRAWGAKRAARDFSWEPDQRRIGKLKELDLRFYEDVLLGMRRHWKYDLIKRIDPIDSPLDFPGRGYEIYERSSMEPRGSRAVQPDERSSAELRSALNVLREAEFGQG